MKMCWVVSYSVFVEFEPIKEAFECCVLSSEAVWWEIWHSFLATVPLVKRSLDIFSLLHIFFLAWLKFHTEIVEVKAGAAAAVWFISALCMIYMALSWWSKLCKDGYLYVFTVACFGFFVIIYSIIFAGGRHCISEFFTLRGRIRLKPALSIIKFSFNQTLIIATHSQFSSGESLFSFLLW